MKRDPIATALAALAEAARAPAGAGARERIRAGLAHRNNHVVGRAARAVGDAGLAALAPELVAAFPRLLTDPIRRDPGCVAKTEIVRALLALELPAPGVYLPGVAHVQREPAFGPPIDTAAELRGLSALALVVTGHPGALGACVELLADAETAARAGGLRALVASGRADVALVLQLVALRGDEDPGVLAEALAGLLALTGGDAVPFVVARLAAGDRDVARAAALALGEARRPEAVAALRERLSAEDRPDVRHAIVLALATSRDETALAALLELIARGPVTDSRAAAGALQLYAHDEELQRRVQAALAARGR
ncbi:MAG TPA: HEAT repeat domain-containing protein [Methylomirabilota bacterium]|nr:HEAT repeat domain-containing protein [Methylomirabilota bacterium]